MMAAAGAAATSNGTASTSAGTYERAPPTPVAQPRHDPAHPPQSNVAGGGGGGGPIAEQERELLRQLPAPGADGEVYVLPDTPEVNDCEECEYTRSFARLDSITNPAPRFRCSKIDPCGLICMPMCITHSFASPCRWRWGGRCGAWRWRWWRRRRTDHQQQQEQEAGEKGGASGRAKRRGRRRVDCRRLWEVGGCGGWLGGRRVVLSID